MLRKHTRFVKYKHIASGKIDNMPEKDWKDHFENHMTRKKEFEFIEVIDVGQGVPVAKEGRVQNLEIEEDPLECPLCGYIADDEKDLKKHKKEKH